MSGLKGNVNDLKKLRKRLHGLPVALAESVAQDAASALTSLAQTAYSSGRNVYGDARPAGKNGPLDLIRTGKTQSTIRFVNIGTIVRCVLPTPYAKFLIGKYRILPMGDMPRTWSVKLGSIVQTQRVKLT